MSYCYIVKLTSENGNIFHYFTFVLSHTTLTVDGCVVGYQRNTVNLVPRRVKQDQSQYPIKSLLLARDCVVYGKGTRDGHPTK